MIKKIETKFILIEIMTIGSIYEDELANLLTLSKKFIVQVLYLSTYSKHRCGKKI